MDTIDDGGAPDPDAWEAPVSAFEACMAENEELRSTVEELKALASRLQGHIRYLNEQGCVANVASRVELATLRAALGICCCRAVAVAPEPDLTDTDPTPVGAPRPVGAHMTLNDQEWAFVKKAHLDSLPLAPGERR